MVPWIKSLLDGERVLYQEVHHPNVFTAAGLAKIEHFSGRKVAKIVVAFADQSPVLLVLPAHHRVCLEALNMVLGAEEVHLASEKEMAVLFADCEVGAEPPLRHWPGLEIWMDSSLRTSGEILFQGGTHHDGVRMNFDDWFRLAQPRVADFVV